MQTEKPLILFVHGLWMHGVVFSAHRRRLRAMGRASRVFSWHSLLGSLDGAADDLAAHIATLGHRPLHLVGHSLGGCLVLNMLARHHPEGIGRTVLLGSPCCGSFAGERILRVPVLRGALGRVLPQWLARPLPEVPPGYEIGVVAGNRPVGMGRIVPGMEKPNDGMVTVAETRWPGARDHAVLAVTHMQMLWSRACLIQTLHFLDTGRFLRGGVRA